MENNSNNCLALRTSFEALVSSCPSPAKSGMCTQESVKTQYGSGDHRAQSLPGEFHLRLGREVVGLSLPLPLFY